uniref:Uncharacterized protein n=1 Tax=Rhizobium leguminosarum bv. viciae TaxID=387 RepID=A0A0U3ICK2_RHILV|nr:hypothetical protein [Rhizobium leguminosarum bv. viciae]
MPEMSRELTSLSADNKKPAKPVTACGHPCHHRITAAPRATAAHGFVKRRDVPEVFYSKHMKN